MSDSVGTWLGVALGILSVVISIGGFWIAIAQIRKTRNALEAHHRAVRQTEARLGLARQSRLLQELQQSQANFDSGIAGRQAQKLRIAVGDWRRTASEMAGTTATDPASESLRSVLHEAMSLAAMIDLTAAANDVDYRSWVEQQLGPAIRSATDLAAEVISRLVAYTGSGGIRE